MQQGRPNSGGRDKDKMTDYPMVLALALERKSRGLTDIHHSTHTLTHTIHRQGMIVLVLISNIHAPWLWFDTIPDVPSPFQTVFSHHPVIYGEDTNMISSVMCCTLGGIIAGLNGDSPIALAREEQTSIVAGGAR